MIQQRFRLFDFLVMRKYVNFGELLRFQIYNGVYKLLDDSDVCFSNFIYQIIVYQSEGGYMFGDDEFMGELRCLNECVFIGRVSYSGGEVYVMYGVQMRLCLIVFGFVSELV